MNPVEGAPRFRWTVLLEAALSVGAIVVVNLLLHPDDLGYRGVQPHPFWIVVLLMALRYRLREALAAAALVAATHAGLGLAARGDAYVFSAIDVLSDFREPISFLIAGGVVSAFTQRQLERNDDLTRRLREREAELQSLADSHHAADTALRELEGRIAGEFNSILDLFRELSRTRQMSVDQIRAHLLDVLGRYVHAEASTFYDVDGDTLVGSHVVGAGAVGQRLHRDEDIILDEALRTTEIAHLGTFGGSEAFARYEGSLLGGCLRTSDFRVLGVVGVRAMPFVDYNPHSFKLFATILDWWSTVLEERLRLDELREQSVFDEEAGLYNYPYFSDRQRQEFERARRFSLPLSLALVNIVDFDRIPALQQGRIRFAVAGILREHVSELEMAAHYRTPDTLAVSFPIGAADDAEARIRAAIESVHRFYFTPYDGDDGPLRLRWTVASYEIGMDSASQLAQRAEALLDDAKVTPA